MKDNIYTMPKACNLSFQSSVETVSIVQRYCLSDSCHILILSLYKMMMLANVLYEIIAVDSLVDGAVACCEA